MNDYYYPDYISPVTEFRELQDTVRMFMKLVKLDLDNLNKILEGKPVDKEE